MSRKKCAGRSVNLNLPGSPSTTLSHSQINPKHSSTFQIFNDFQWGTKDMIFKGGGE